MLLFIAKIFNVKDKKNLFKKYSMYFAVILLISFIVLHSAYFFSFGTIAESIPQRNAKFIDYLVAKNFGKGSFSNEALNFIVHDLKIPMPEYWAGFAGQYYIESTQQKTAYLNGNEYSDGKWYYFFEVLLIKTPIPLIIFFIIANNIFSWSIYKKQFQFRLEAHTSNNPFHICI